MFIHDEEAVYPLICASGYDETIMVKQVVHSDHQ